jgi:hypothetical protein
MAGAALALLMLPNSASARVVTVKVDAHCGPWSTGINPKLRFGLGDGRPPVVVWNLPAPAGRIVRFKASGTTTTVTNGPSATADGYNGWVIARGIALLPAAYIPGKRPVAVNQLVGAFIDSDGVVVGQPFAIGTEAEVRAPDDAVALSLGINDDRFSDNSGVLTVDITVTEGKVTVEGGAETK